MEFYRDVLDMELEYNMDLPDDYGYMLKVNDDAKLWIGYHSEIKGSVKEPDRHIFNLYVDSVKKAYKKIKDDKGIRIIRAPKETPFLIPKDPWHASTFLLSEENYWQFMEGK